MEYKGKRVKRTPIIGTNIVVWSVWETYAGHSSIMWIDRVQMGRVGTRPLPSDLAALPPGSDERYEAVSEWLKAQYEEAYTAIRAVAPNLQECWADMGEITERGERANENI